MASDKRHTKQFSYIDENQAEIRHAGYLDYQPSSLRDGADITEHDKQRYNEIKNYMEVRNEYYRTVKARGLWYIIYNPFPFIGVTVMCASLVLSWRRKEEKAKYRMLNWRAYAAIFTIFTTMGGVYINQVKEDRWVRRTCIKRNLPVNMNDIGAPLAQLKPLVNKVRRHQLLQEEQGKPEQKTMK